MASISNEINGVFNDLTSGKCFNNFNSMTDETKIKTILKTAAAALLAGIITGVLIGLASPIAGTVVGITIAAVVGIGTFAYLTSSYTPLDHLKDHANQCLGKVKSNLNKIFNS